MAFPSISRIPLIALILSWIPLQAAWAETYVVNPDGTGDFPNIKEAVAASVDDDEILLGSGIFTGADNHDVSILNKRITIRSQSDDPNQCIIDCNGRYGLDARAFTNSSTDASGPLIRGITMRDGAAGLGGAIVTNGSLRLENCKFLENQANIAGAIYIFQPDLPRRSTSYFGGRTVRIEDCDFISNTAEVEGGAISHLDSTTEVIITNCRFIKNASGQFGGAIFAIISFQMEGTILAKNEAGDSGGAIVCVGGGLFSGCTLALNIAPEGSAIFYGAPIHGRGLILSVSTSIIAFSEGGQPVSCEDTALIEFICCDVYGNSAGDWVGCIEGLDAAGGNISEDPLFCGLEISDPHVFGDRFTLSPESPCLPGARGCAVMGARGVEECGESPGNPLMRSVQPTTWGRIKGNYR